jgi:hypothetical protein
VSLSFFSFELFFPFPLEFNSFQQSNPNMNYARNSYHDEFIDSPPHFSSRAPSHFSHGPNQRSYGFISRGSGHVPRRFSVDPHSHRGDHPPYLHGFPVRGVYSQFEPSCLDGPHFPHRGSHTTHSNGEMQKIVKTYLGRMVKYWTPKSFLSNPSTEPSIFSHSI